MCVQSCAEKAAKGRNKRLHTEVRVCEVHRRSVQKKKKCPCVRLGKSGHIVAWPSAQFIKFIQVNSKPKPKVSLDFQNSSRSIEANILALVILPPWHQRPQEFSPCHKGWVTGARPILTPSYRLFQQQAGTAFLSKTAAGFCYLFTSAFNIHVLVSTPGRNM